MIAWGSTWEAILSGGRRDQAEAVINDISACLREPRGPSVRPGARAQTEPSAGHLSLSGGWPGPALLFAFQSLSSPGTLPDFAARDRARTLLTKIVDSTPEVDLSPSFYGGFTGVGWSVELLGKLVTPDDPSDKGEEIDIAVLELLSLPAWRRDYDLISGLVGLGVYCLERPRSPNMLESLGRIVRHLDSGARRPEEERVTWWTDPRHLPPHQREMAPGGWYNLGLAHGIPGVVSFLAGAHRAGVETDLTRVLVDGAINWLVEQRLPPGSGSAFPDCSIEGVQAERSRLAWCYGDLGVASCIELAAGEFDRPDWGALALELALGAAERIPEDSGVLDAGFCHGAAGNAHCFNRLFQVLADERLRTASERWIDLTLAIRRPGRGLAGYLTRWQEQDGQVSWLEDPGLLTGISGIGLSLLAATSSVEPQWDRALLLSLAPR